MDLRNTRSPLGQILVLENKEHCWKCQSLLCNALDGYLSGLCNCSFYFPIRRNKQYRYFWWEMKLIINLEIHWSTHLSEAVKLKFLFCLKFLFLLLAEDINTFLNYKQKVELTLQIFFPFVISYDEIVIFCYS